MHSHPTGGHARLCCTFDFNAKVDGKYVGSVFET